MKELSVTIVVMHIPSTEIIITLPNEQNLPVLLCFPSASASSTSHKPHNNKLRCAQRRVYQRVQSQGRCRSKYSHRSDTPLFELLAQALANVRGK